MSDALAPPGGNGDGALIPLAPERIGPAELYMASLREGQSRSTALEAFRRVTRILTGQTDKDAWRAVPWASLTAKETTLIKSYLQKSCGPATGRLTMSMLRGILKQCYRLELMPADQYQRAIMLDPIRGKAKRAGRMLTEEEVKKLVAHINSVPPPLGTMLGALFAAGLGAGLRRDELASLRADAFRGDALVVHGKGNKERLQPIPAWVAARFQSWVDARKALDLQCGRMFIRNPKRDVPFTPHGIWEVVVEIGKRAGVARYTTHDLRRTFASRMLDKSDLSITKTLMGHEYATTTVLYDRRDDKVAEQAVAGLEGWGFENWEERGMSKDDVVEKIVVEQSGQELVDRRAAREMKRRVVTKPDFTRDGAPCSVAWLVKQSLALYLKGRSTGAIVAAFNSIGVRKGSGEDVDESDVKRWLAL